MTIERITAKDFCCFKELDLWLLKRGLVLVTGDNNDTSAADNNGSGKSTIAKALTWGLFGETLDGDRHDEVIRWNAKEAEVNVYMKYPAHSPIDWCIRRVRQKGKPIVTLSNSLDGKEWSLIAGDSKEIQSKIIEIVGLDFRGFCNTALFGQGDMNRFFASGDVERKETLHRILRTDIYRAAEKKARETASELRSGKLEKEQAIAILNARIQEINLERLSQRVKEEEEYRSFRIESLADDADKLLQSAEKLELDYRKKSSELQKLIEESKKLIKELHAQEPKVQEELSKLYSSKKAHEQNKEGLARLKAEKAKIEQALKAFDSEICPVCNSPMDSDAPAAYRSNLESDLEKIKSSLEVAFNMVEVWSKKIDAEEKRINDRRRELSVSIDSEEFLLRSRLSQLSELNIVGEKKRLISMAKNNLLEIERLKGSDEGYKKELQDAKNKLNKYRSDLGTLEGELSKIKHSLELFEFWVKGFGVQGLPSLILDASMPFLTKRTNEYLGILSDGDITVELSTQRELKSKKGELKDELSISWIIEGIPRVTPSNGQRRKMEIALDLALMDLVSSREGGLDLLILDEVLDGLDAEGRSRVVRLLESLRIKRKSIFVITHDREIAGSFEKVVKVVKRDGASIIREDGAEDE